MKRQIRFNHIASHGINGVVVRNYRYFSSHHNCYFKTHSMYTSALSVCDCIERMNGTAQNAWKRGAGWQSALFNVPNVMNSGQITNIVCRWAITQTIQTIKFYRANSTIRMAIRKRFGRPLFVKRANQRQNERINEPTNERAHTVSQKIDVFTYLFAWIKCSCT